MLEKASLKLNNNGMILYMVCSFLKCETEDQINNFLEKHDGFKLFEIESVHKQEEYRSFLLLKGVFL